MKSGRFSSAAVLFPVLLFWLTGSGLAQVSNPAVSDTIPRFESIAPQPLPEDPGEVDRVKPPPAAEVTDDTELVKELKGLWFTSRKEEILAAGRKEPREVTISGLPLLESPEVRQSLDGRLGGPVTLKRLNDLVKEIVTIYRDQDLPVVDVLIPEQDITTGIVQILVLEGRVEDIKSEGNRWFSDRRITGPVRLERGGRILSRPLVEDLNFLNRNPFRQVEVLFTPGEGPGMTDVVLKTRDRFPVRFYSGYEDTGNDITAEERMLFGFNWGNAFGLDHTLNYQYSISPDLLASRSHAFSYDIPILRDHRLTAFMSYSQAKADVTGAGVPGLETDGTSFQSGFRYRHQLPGSQGGFRHALTTGLDQRRVNNDLFSGSLSLNAEQTEIFQAVGGYGLDWVDPWGAAFRAEMTGFFSPGGVGNFNNRETFEKSRAFADASYTYVRFQVERRQPLYWGFEIQGRFNSQLADTNLLSTEQMGIGGYSTVRGYTESEIRGDEGWCTNLEFYTPAVKFDRIFDWTGHAAELRFLGFWDYGQVGNVTLLAGENPDGELSSAGGGLRLFIDRYFSARMDYGFQLLDSGFNKRFDSRIHLGLIISY